MATKFKQGDLVLVEGVVAATDERLVQVDIGGGRSWMFPWRIHHDPNPKREDTKVRPRKKARRRADNG